MDRFKKLIASLVICIFGGGIAFAQTSVKVSGVVTSAEDNMPLIGVTVIAGPGIGVSTSVDGDYIIEVAPGTKLVYSSIGFIDEEFTVPSGVSEIRNDVVLQTENTRLDDVVVIAYGVRKKGTITGSVATVKSQAIEATPTAAFDQALQGQVPGLMVLSNSGEPSASATMTIRGTNSINSGTAPLYILDGVAISASDFNTINPSDIESLTVLRDASSTSIYGARAANGVIVITTKRGRQSDRPFINYRMQLGFSDLAYGNWDLMNTAERIQYEKEIGLTDGKDYNILSQTDVNWLDAVYKDAALLQSYELSVSGATDKTNYYFSGGYYDQEGIAPGSDFKRYSIRFNVEQQAAKWLKIGTNTMLNYQGIEQADEGQYALVAPISAARFMLPYWNPFRKDGSLASINDGSWKGQGQNPLEWLENNPRAYKKYKVMSTVFAEATPIEGLSIRSQFAVDYAHSTGFSKSNPSYAPNQEDGTASRNTSDGLSLNISNTISYRFDIQDMHSFNFLVGQEGVTYHYESFGVATAGQNNDFLTDIATGTRAKSWDSTSSADYSLLSFFARAEYNYDSRYFVELSARADGSSRFGSQGRYAGFWSAGLMWNMRNERFMQHTSSWLTNAQISLSTGTSGNSSIPNYEHLALVGGGMDYVGNAGVVPIQPGNEKLGWESTWTTNLGLHFGFWNRLNVDLELYDKETSNMLMEVPLSYATSNGYGYMWDNVGKMRNLGAELNIAATAIAYKDFTWTINANVGYNRNVITELYNGVTEYEPANTSTKLVVGQSLGQFYMNRFYGVNPANGDALWLTKDGQITTELRDADKVLTGKTSIAPWQGGFGTSLSWKGLSLSAQFSWVAGRYMINNDRYFDESNGRFMSYNQSNRLLDRWKEPGDITDIPRHGVYTEFDTRLLEDASFLRLKNLTLSYSFPAELLKKSVVFRGLRIYAQGQNLFTVTGFSGLDPEGSTNMYQAAYPMSRQFTFGLDLTF
ncbi:MAG: TonB-dependent receptor [Bacteroidales bacterium]|nr:TonB-dependent receptor [Bacteroides sp.]MCM1503243.1 TonB-dependent receptor [Bacteroidales bacterium]